MYIFIAKLRKCMKTGLMLLVCLVVSVLWVNAQETSYPLVTVSLDGGRIGIKEGDFLGRPNDALYHKVLDSVSTVLQRDSLDQDAWFLEALMHSQYYLMRPPTEAQLEVLEQSATAIDSAFSKGKDDLMAKVLRARIYYQLMSCFIADEGWKYEKDVVRRDRKTRFERYQALSNRYHEELMELDAAHSLDHKQRINHAAYPLSVK